jgi:putative nucleotide binding protein
MKKRNHQTRQHEKKKQNKRFGYIGESYVIDFYPQGKSLSRKRFNDYNPLVVVITTNFFQFYDVILSVESKFTAGDKLKINPRNKSILHLDKLNYSQLSNSALNQLPSIVQEIVSAFEDSYVSFINQAHPLTTQMHQLLLLPGVGQKRMWAILEARKKASFSSFNDFSERTGISDPNTLFSGRILLELENSPKYRLFTKKPNEV